MDYFPYGKILREFIKTSEKYVTTRHERDTETGLDYRGARFYDSDVARFLSLDPLAAEFPEWSAYNYVLGNPVMLVDPDGKEADNPVYLSHEGKVLGENNENATEYRLIDESKYNKHKDNASKLLSKSKKITFDIDSERAQLDFVPKNINH
jgi:RHS repeat-associated protein